MDRDRRSSVIETLEQAERPLVPSFVARNRYLIQGAADAVAWALALAFAVAVRFDFAFDRIDPWGLAVAVLVVVVGQVIAGCGWGLYTGRWRYGSFEEVAALAGASATTGAVLFLCNVIGSGRLVPRSAVAAGGITALVLMGGARVWWRGRLERRQRPGAHAARLLVFGAGNASETLLSALLRDPSSPYLPVALLDDDPAKRRLRVKGVPVVGTADDVAEAARASGADTLLIAVPSAGADLIRRLTERAESCGLEVLVLPPVADLVGQSVSADDIRPLTIIDLLGRREVDTDIGGIAEYLTGRRVLVTGAGGSIGSELCRQIHRFGPESLVMLDRDESALHAVQLSIEGRALLDTPGLVLADLRDEERIREVFRIHRPHVVFHAAALKHLTLLERNPAEALKTNVHGTLTVLEAAAAAGVERFVNISTDKAADPTSVLGSSKRVAERLTAHIALQAGGTYLSVRFGNVLGSRGSVLGTFQAQVAAGGPITVTHPDVTRYFMTVEEAVQLTIQAGAIGRDGEVLVLDMGEPVRIADVAERLANEAERRIEIVYTGLRPGEKLHEVLTSGAELGVKRGHELIDHVTVPALDPRLLEDAAGWSDPARIAGMLAELCVDGRQRTT